MYDLKITNHNNTFRHFISDQRNRSITLYRFRTLIQKSQSKSKTILTRRHRRPPDKLPRRDGERRRFVSFRIVRFAKATFCTYLSVRRESFDLLRFAVKQTSISHRSRHCGTNAPYVGPHRTLSIRDTRRIEFRLYSLHTFSSGT